MSAGHGEGKRHGLGSAAHAVAQLPSALCPVSEASAVLLDRIHRRLVFPLCSGSD